MNFWAVLFKFRFLNNHQNMRTMNLLASCVTYLLGTLDVHTKFGACLFKHSNDAIGADVILSKLRITNIHTRLRNVNCTLIWKKSVRSNTMYRK